MDAYRNPRQSLNSSRKDQQIAASTTNSFDWATLCRRLNEPMHKAETRQPIQELRYFELNKEYQQCVAIF